ncbi:MAG TPA: hypothetical protein VMZ53_13050 [Kofleriaceae bacterium]|nr:hypothetical protein [Kofleriaceae bacterium]
MSELHTRLRQILAALTASDPACKRFGAAQHRYELLPPVTDIELSQIDERLAATDAAPSGVLPEDYADYIARFSAGGVGPYYGLLRADRAAAFLIDAPSTVTAWKRALPIAHVGCGYAAVMPLDGAAAGQIWIDARSLQLVAPVRPSFTAFYLDWIDRLAQPQGLDPFVPPNQCAVVAALTGYLAMTEQQRGLAAGSLDGEALRETLGELGVGAIEVTASAPLPIFHAGDRVDPCVACARALQGFAEQGLRLDVVAPGLPPLPARN